MKSLKLLLGAILVSSLLLSCKEEVKPERDLTAKIYINGVDNSLKSLNKKLTVHEICQEDTLYMRMATSKYGSAGRGFIKRDGEIDTINNRLIMSAGNIETLKNNVFLTCRNIIIGSCSIDTIAYVPTIQRKEAYDKLLVLWESENWDEIYDIFNNAFTFIPITGEEYRKIEESEYLYQF